MHFDSRFPFLCLYCFSSARRVHSNLQFQSRWLLSICQNSLQIFESKLLAMCGRLLSWYTTLVFLLLNFYFITSTGIVRTELRGFNKRFEASCYNSNQYSFQNELSEGHLTSNKKPELQQLFSTVHSFYLEHLRISNKIRELDRSLSVSPLNCKLYIV
jgi:hypothetical protein